MRTTSPVQPRIFLAPPAIISTVATRGSQMWSGSGCTTPKHFVQTPSCGCLVSRPILTVRSSCQFYERYSSHIIFESVACLSAFLDWRKPRMPPMSLGLGRGSPLPKPKPQTSLVYGGERGNYYFPFFFPRGYYFFVLLWADFKSELLVLYCFVR